eukprot:261776-Prorocentrum_minimum.AAC.1
MVRLPSVGSPAGAPVDGLDGGGRRMALIGCAKASAMENMPTKVCMLSKWRLPLSSVLMSTTSSPTTISSSA